MRLQGLIQGNPVNLATIFAFCCKNGHLASAWVRELVAALAQARPSPSAPGVTQLS